LKVRAVRDGSQSLSDLQQVVSKNRPIRALGTNRAVQEDQLRPVRVGTRAQPRTTGRARAPRGERPPRLTP
jgi:hypothetical protein